MPTQRAKPGAASARNKAVGKRAPKKPDVNVFIAEYKIDRNGRRAAIAAGYSEKSAAAQASRLLSKANIRAEVDSHYAEVVAKVQADTGITLERTLREIARIAYFDARRLFGKDGRPLAITELDDDTAAVIAGLDVTELPAANGDGAQVGLVKKWKLSDKRGGLDMLMKHLGGYEVDNAQSRAVSVTVVNLTDTQEQAGAWRKPPQ